MDLSKEELQLIYLGLHTISTSYAIEGDLESVFLNLLDKVSIEIDKKSEVYWCRSKVYELYNWELLV